jgi:hypothetical protein
MLKMGLMLEDLRLSQQDSIMKRVPRETDRVVCSQARTVS